MKTNFDRSPRQARSARVHAGASALAIGVAASASPAFADHAGLAVSGGTGGGMDVIGPATLERDTVALGLRIAYLRPEQRSNEALAELAEADVHAHNSDYFLATVLDAAWGVTDRLTVSAQIPFVRRDGLREGQHHEQGEHGHGAGEEHGAVAGLGNVSGIGDASLLAKFRLTGAGATQLSLIAGVKLPTGATHQHSLSGVRLETEHQPGTGSWDFLAGASAGTRIGPLQADASLLFQFSGKGAQATRLGDRLQAGVALSHRFGPSEAHREHTDHGHASWDTFLEFTAEWEGRQRVAGHVERESGGTSLWLQPGLRYNSASGLSLGAALGLPVWQDIRASHPENRVRLILSVAKTF